MTVKTGGAWAGTFVTQDSTGALATPSSGPAGALYVDGVADAATVTITGSNPYKFAVTLPSLTAGQRVDMYITATIATIATAGIVASEQADTALVGEVKTETAAILADTGTDGVVLKAAGLAEDAVTEIQNGLALEATLTAIKGAGWTTETLKAIADAISALNDPTPQQVWEYATRSLSNPSDYKADVSGLATTAHVQEVEDKVDNLDGDVADVFDDVGGIKAELDLVHAKTNNLPADPADQSAVEAAITAAVTSVKGADGDTLKVLSDQIDGIDASAIADAVWDEATGDHVIVGSAGDSLSSTEGNTSDIKIVTDQFVFTVANQVDANALTGSAGVTAQQVRAEMDSNSTRFILIEQLLRNRMITDPTTGIMTLYDDAGNPLMSANIFQDAAGTIPYQGQGVERKERLT